MPAKSLICILVLLAAACGSPADPEPGPSSPEPTGSEAQPQETVQIFLSAGNPDDCAEVVAVERTVGGRPTLATGMEQLLAGPTEAERQRGLGGWFGESTKDMLISAERQDDVARVDFKDLRQVIPNASTSCGSAGLLAQLDATAKQFGASQTLYSINGDLDTFYHWLQRETPDP